jgi:threonine synthase
MKPDTDQPIGKQGLAPVQEATMTAACVSCHKTFEHGFVPFCTDCGDMVDMDYDLQQVRLVQSPNPYERFRDLLPVKDPQLLPSDARFTPTVHARKLGAELGMANLYLKNETVLPTGSTKDRMAAVALAYLWECGVRCFCTSSTGNSSTAYARTITNFPGFTMFLSSASDFHKRVQFPATEQVVHLVLRDATFVDAFNFAGSFAKEHGFVSERGFFNPGRREGLKLAFMEATEQVPRPIDWYVQGVSSAMGVFGTYKAATQLHGMGRIRRMPRMLCAQQQSCSPMVHAWEEDCDTIQPHHIVANPKGIAKAILRGDPTGAYPHMRRIVQDTKGSFVAASEQEIREARQMAEQLEDISPCFSASTALAGIIKSVRSGKISPDDTVLVNLTGRDREPSDQIPPNHWLHRKDDRWIPEDPTDPVLQSLWTQ